MVETLISLETHCFPLLMAFLTYWPLRKAFVRRVSIGSPPREAESFVELDSLAFTKWAAPENDLRLGFAPLLREGAPQSPMKEDPSLLRYILRYILPACLD